MSTTEDRTGQIVELIDQYTEIGISEDPARWGTFERVLADMAAAALDYEAEHGDVDRELVTAFEVIAASFERITTEDQAALET